MSQLCVYVLYEWAFYMYVRYVGDVCMYVFHVCYVVYVCMYSCM